MVSDAEVAEVAHSAAIETILSHFESEAVDDLDVTTSFEDGDLTVDVYLHVPGEETDGVVTEAVEAGIDAVDQLLDG